MESEVISPDESVQKNMNGDQQKQIEHMDCDSVDTLKSDKTTPPSENMECGDNAPLTVKNGTHGAEAETLVADNSAHGKLFDTVLSECGNELITYFNKWMKFSEVFYPKFSLSPVDNGDRFRCRIFIFRKPKTDNDSAEKIFEIHHKDRNMAQRMASVKCVQYLMRSGAMPVGEVPPAVVALVEAYEKHSAENDMPLLTKYAPCDDDFGEDSSISDYEGDGLEVTEKREAFYIALNGDVGDKIPEFLDDWCARTKKCSAVYDLKSEDKENGRRYWTCETALVENDTLKMCKCVSLKKKVAKNKSAVCCVQFLVEESYMKFEDIPRKIRKLFQSTVLKNWCSKVSAPRVQMIKQEPKDDYEDMQNGYSLKIKSEPVDPDESKSGKKKQRRRRAPKVKIKREPVDWNDLVSKPYYRGGLAADLYTKMFKEHNLKQFQIPLPRIKLTDYRHDGKYYPYKTTHLKKEPSTAQMEDERREKSSSPELVDTIGQPTVLSDSESEDEEKPPVVTVTLDEEEEELVGQTVRQAAIATPARSPIVEPMTVTSEVGPTVGQAAVQPTDGPAIATPAHSPFVEPMMVTSEVGQTVESKVIESYVGQVDVKPLKPAVVDDESMEVDAEIEKENKDPKGFTAEKVDIKVDVKEIKIKDDASDMSMEVDEVKVPVDYAALFNLKKFNIAPTNLTLRDIELLVEKTRVESKRKRAERAAMLAEEDEVHPERKLGPKKYTEEESMSDSKRRFLRKLKGQMGEEMTRFMRDWTARNKRYTLKVDNDWQKEDQKWNCKMKLFKTTDNIPKNQKIIQRIDDNRLMAVRRCYVMAAKYLIMNEAMKPSDIPESIRAFLSEVDKDISKVLVKGAKSHSDKPKSDAFKIPQIASSAGDTSFKIPKAATISEVQDFFEKWISEHKDCKSEYNLKSLGRGDSWKCSMTLKVAGAAKEIDAVADTPVIAIRNSVVLGIEYLLRVRAMPYLDIPANIRQTISNVMHDPDPMRDNESSHAEENGAEPESEEETKNKTFSVLCRKADEMEKVRNYFDTLCSKHNYSPKFVFKDRSSLRGSYLILNNLWECTLDLYSSSKFASSILDAPIVGAEETRSLAENKAILLCLAYLLRKQTVSIRDVPRAVGSFFVQSHSGPYVWRDRLEVVSERTDTKEMEPWRGPGCQEFVLFLKTWCQDNRHKFDIAVDKVSEEHMSNLTMHCPGKEPVRVSTTEACELFARTKVCFLGIKRLLLIKRLKPDAIPEKLVKFFEKDLPKSKESRQEFEFEWQGPKGLEIREFIRDWCRNNNFKEHYEMKLNKDIWSCQLVIAHAIQDIKHSVTSSEWSKIANNTGDEIAKNKAAFWMVKRLLNGGFMTANDIPETVISCFEEHAATGDDQQGPEIWEGVLGQQMVVLLKDWCAKKKYNAPTYKYWKDTTTKMTSCTLLILQGTSPVVSTTTQQSTELLAQKKATFLAVKRLIERDLMSPTELGPELGSLFEKKESVAAPAPERKVESQIIEENVRYDQGDIYKNFLEKWCAKNQFSTKYAFLNVGELVECTLLVHGLKDPVELSMSETTRDRAQKKVVYFGIKRLLDVKYMKIDDIPTSIAQSFDHRWKKAQEAPLRSFLNSFSVKNNATAKFKFYSTNTETQCQLKIEGLSTPIEIASYDKLHQQASIKTSWFGVRNLLELGLIEKSDLPESLRATFEDETDIKDATSKNGNPGNPGNSGGPSGNPGYPGNPNNPGDSPDNPGGNPHASVPPTPMYEQSARHGGGGQTDAAGKTIRDDMWRTEKGSKMNRFIKEWCDRKNVDYDFKHSRNQGRFECVLTITGLGSGKISKRALDFSEEIAERHVSFSAIEHLLESKLMRESDLPSSLLDCFVKRRGGSSSENVPRRSTSVSSDTTPVKIDSPGEAMVYYVTNYCRDNATSPKYEYTENDDGRTVTCRLTFSGPDFVVDETATEKLRSMAKKKVSWQAIRHLLELNKVLHRHLPSNIADLFEDMRSIWIQPTDKDNKVFRANSEVWDGPLGDQVQIFFDSWCTQKGLVCNFTCKRKESRNRSNKFNGEMEVTNYKFPMRVTCSEQSAVLCAKKATWLVIKHFLIKTDEVQYPDIPPNLRKLFDPDWVIPQPSVKHATHFLEGKVKLEPVEEPSTSTCGFSLPPQVHYAAQPTTMPIIPNTTVATAPIHDAVAASNGSQLAHAPGAADLGDVEIQVLEHSGANRPGDANVLDVQNKYGFVFAVPKAPKPLPEDTDDVIEIPKDGEETPPKSNSVLDQIRSKLFGGSKDPSGAAKPKTKLSDMLIRKIKVEPEDQVDTPKVVEPPKLTDILTRMTQDNGGSDLASELYDQGQKSSQMAQKLLAQRKRAQEENDSAENKRYRSDF